MRILICHQRYKQRGGEDTVFEEEVSALKAQGHDVHVFEVSHNRVILLNAFEFVFSCLGLSVSLFKLKKKIKHFRPHIVRFHNVFPLITTKAFKVAKGLGSITILVLHNFRPMCMNGLMFKKGQLCSECVDKKSYMPGIVNACYRNSFFQSLLAGIAWKLTYLRNDFNYVDRFICLSYGSRNKYEKINFPIEKLFVVRNRINKEFIYSPKIHQIKKYDFLFLGRLSKEKGVDIFLRLSKLFPEYMYAIAGDGPEASYVKSFLKNENVLNVSYLGKLGKEEVAQVLDSSKVLVITSFWEEHCPMVILEAYSRAIPVISLNLGGQAELVKEVDSRLLFEVNDLNSFKKSALFALSFNEKEKLHEVVKRINQEWFLDFQKLDQ